MIIEIDSFDILVVYSKKYTKSEFLQAFQTFDGTYADVFANRIYQCLFLNTKNLYTEYSRYYKIEYSKFSDYLYWKYNIDFDIIQKIEESMDSKTFVGLGRNSINMFADEIFMTALRKVFRRLGEKKYED